MEITLLLVRVSIDDEVDSRYLARHPLGDIFAWQSGGDSIVARWLVEAGVNAHDHNVRARGFHLLHRRLHRGDDVGELHSSSNVLRIPRHDAGSSRTDYSDLDSLPLNYRPGLEVMRAVRIPCVR